MSKTSIDTDATQSWMFEPLKSDSIDSDNLDFAQHKIFICGTVRNCERYLDDVFNNIRLIASLFSDVHIIIAYDESCDQSLLKLTQYKREYGGKMDILLNRCALSHIRTQNISNARNTIINKMRELNANEHPYFIMMDMDDVCSNLPNLDVIRRALKCEHLWDSISFNRKDYYDIWALSIMPYIYSCWGWYGSQQVVDLTRRYIIDKLNNVPAGELLACRSAFNGFAIYKTNPFLKCSYDWKMPKQYMEVEDLHQNHAAVRYLYTMTDLFSQTDEPDCEHRAFHMEASAKYGARIMISPECVFDSLDPEFG